MTIDVSHLRAADFTCRSMEGSERFVFPGYQAAFGVQV